MKRTVCLLTACLLLFTAASAAQAQSESDTENAAPLVVLNEGYNPFFDIVFPDTYSMTSVKCTLSDNLKYVLCLSTSDAMEQVIAFAAGLLADDTVVDQMGIAMNLMNGDAAEINGEIGSLPVRIQIADHQVEGSEESSGRFELELTTTMDPDPKFEALIGTNLQHPVCNEISSYFPLLPLEQVSLTIYRDQNRAELFSSYSLENAGQIKAALLKAYPDQYYEPNDWLVWRIGEMQIAIVLESATDGYLHILANFASPDISLLDYVPQKTLKALGFEDFREPSAKCTNQNNEAGVWLSISKSEWGENEYESERDALTFMAQEHDAFILLFYYPQTQSYMITVEYGGEQAKYTYLAGENRYTDIFGGDDLAEAIRITTAAFLSPEEEFDDVLSLAWSILDSFVADTFECTMDELYALDYE